MRGRPRIHAQSTHEPRWTPNNDELVGALVSQYPQINRGRLSFLSDIEKAFPITKGELPSFRRVPDAYCILPEEGRVDLFEVEVTHPVQRSTMLHYGKLWFVLDTFGITLELHIVNRYGHIAPLSMELWYYTLLKEELAHVDMDRDRADSGTPGNEAAGSTGQAVEAA